MSKKIFKTGFCLTLTMGLFFTFCQPVIADKPSWAGNKGNGHPKGKKDKGNKKSQSKYYETSQNAYFTTEQRKIIRNYYSEEYDRGHCPPGLAKKNNGCMPPGQAKKWRKGYPLSDDVDFYDLPSDIVWQLGRPPEGHRYIRVAGDILLIAEGTRMIIDAIQGLNSM